MQRAEKVTAGKAAEKKRRWLKALLAGMRGKCVREQAGGTKAFLKASLQYLRTAGTVNGPKETNTEWNSG